MLRTVLPILAAALPLPSHGWAIDACVGLVLGVLVGVAHVLILVLAARVGSRVDRARVTTGAHASWSSGASESSDGPGSDWGGTCETT